MQMKHKLKCGMSAKQTVNHFVLLSIKCETEYSANRPYDSSEILSTFKKPYKEKINYLRIQRFKRRLIHWFHFDPIRDLSHLLTVKKFLLHSAAEFPCEQKPSIF